MRVSRKKEPSTTERQSIIDLNFSDRAGLSYTNDVETLQNQLLKALNLNIIVEEQRLQSNTAKIRFYETLKLLRGKQNSKKSSSNLSNSSDLRQLNYSHSEKLTLMQLQTLQSSHERIDVNQMIPQIFAGKIPSQYLLHSNSSSDNLYS